MICRKVMDILEENYPEKYALAWDNVGLLAGRDDKEVARIYIALDATDEVIDAAVSWEADMIITHHPLIFGKHFNLPSGPPPTRGSRKERQGSGPV